MMKIVISGFLFLFFAVAVCAQDKIITKKGQVINADVVEQTNTIIKYRMPDYPDGPLIWIKKNQLSGLEYRNGSKDLLGSQNPRRNRPLGVSAGIAYWLSEEGGNILATVDYFILPQVDLEVNVGTDFAGSHFSAGTRLHLNSTNSDNRFTPFSGLLVGLDYGFGFLQVPVGLSYISNFGLNVSLSLNEMFYFYDWQTTFVELRAGWRF